MAHGRGNWGGEDRRRKMALMFTSNRGEDK